MSTASTGCAPPAKSRAALHPWLQPAAPMGPKGALCDVEYNDVSRTFQTWHSELKGGLSAYEKERRTRTEVSRYRKTRAVLAEILFLRFDKAAIERLGQMKQGRNSNSKPRPPKYMLDLEDVDGILVDRLPFCKKRQTPLYAATVAAHTSDHGPFSPRVLTHRRA